MNVKKSVASVLAATTIALSFVTPAMATNVNSTTTTAAVNTAAPTIKTTDVQTVEWVLPPTYTAYSVGNFSDGMAYYQTNKNDFSSKHFVDTNGKEQFSGIEARDFHYGYAVATDPSTKLLGLIDKTGKFIVPGMFVTMADVQDSEAGMWFDGTTTSGTQNTYFINHNKWTDAAIKANAEIQAKESNTMETLTAKGIQCGGFDKNGIAFVWKDSGEQITATTSGMKFGIVDLNGNFIVPMNYNEQGRAWPESGYYTLTNVISEGDASRTQAYVFDKTGKQVYSFVCGWDPQDYGTTNSANVNIDEIGDGIGTALYMGEGTMPMGYATPAGKWIIEPIFQNAMPFSEGLAWVEYNGKWGIIKNPELTTSSSTTTGGTTTATSSTTADVSIPVGLTVSNGTKTYTVTDSGNHNTASSNADASTSTSFTDITGNWSESYVKQLVSYGIINGYPDHTFKPNKSVSNAEIAKMVAQAAAKLNTTALTTYAGSADSFYNDVSGTWAASYVNTLTATGIIEKDSSAAAYWPDRGASRISVLKMLVRAMGYKDDGSVTTSTYPDVKDKSDMYYVAMGTKLGIITGNPDGTLTPENSITRAETSAMIVRAVGAKSTNAAATITTVAPAISTN